MIPNGPTRVLVALIRVYQRDGRATTRTVAAEAGVALGHTHKHLSTLRDHGLVTWTERHKGTLRPTVTVVQRAS